MLPSDWIEHRRGADGELVGWMKAVGEGFVVIDLLGRERSGIGDWLRAEETLDELGIGYLADPYELQLANGVWLRVRLTEVSVHRVRVTRDEWGAVDAELMYLLPFPAPDRLRPLRAAESTD